VFTRSSALLRPGAAMDVPPVASDGVDGPPSRGPRPADADLRTCRGEKSEVGGLDQPARECSPLAQGEAGVERRRAGLAGCGNHHPSQRRTTPALTRYREPAVAPPVLEG
jgi:hypothetical protein